MDNRSGRNSNWRALLDWHLRPTARKNVEREVILLNDKTFMRLHPVLCRYGEFLYDQPRETESP